MRQGFSLVELSIVLVILGLLTGGILTGQNLIRAAELRAITTEYGSYQTAVNTFKDKYFAIPGDMNNAQSFWGATVVANGDGDGIIEAASAASAAGEVFGFWEQLALAGMIEGSFNGLAGAGAVNHAVPATNVPRSKFNNAGWSVENVATQINTSLVYFEGTYGNMMFFGAGTTANSTNAAIIPPEESWNVDTKIDDGRPGLGTVRTFESLGHTTDGCSNGAAAATDTATTATYDLNNGLAACALIFNLN